MAYGKGSKKGGKCGGGTKKDGSLPKTTVQVVTGGNRFATKGK